MHEFPIWKFKVSYFSTFETKHTRNSSRRKKNSFLRLKKNNVVDKFRKVVILEVDVLIIVHRLPPLAP